MFGALIELDGEWNTRTRTFPKLRHIHPWELAVISAVPPIWNFDDQMRLWISGLGQMASPVQSAWMVSHFTQVTQESLGEPPIMPEAVLGNLFNHLFVLIAQQQPDIAQHPTFVQYANRVWITLAQSCQDQKVPPLVPRQDHENSQRPGRNDPQLGEGYFLGNKQPASGAPGPKAEDSIPNTPLKDRVGSAKHPSFAHLHHSGAEPCVPSVDHHHFGNRRAANHVGVHSLSDSIEAKVIPFAPREETKNSQRLGRKDPSSEGGTLGTPKKQPAAGSQEPQEEVENPSHPPTGTVSSGVSFGHHHHDDELICSGKSFAHHHWMSHETLVKKGLLPLQSGHGTTHTVVAQKPDACSHTHESHPHVLQDMLPGIFGHPSSASDEHAGSDAEDRKTSQGTDRRKRANSAPPRPHASSEEQQAKKQKCAEGDLTCASSVFQPRPVHGGIPAFATCNGETQRGTEEPQHKTEILGEVTPEMRGPLAIEDGLTPELAHAVNELDDPCPVHPDSANTHWITVVKFDDLQPHYLRVHADSTVGSITVAEAEPKLMEQPIRASNLVGQALPNSQQTVAFQQIILQEMIDFDQVPTHVPPTLGGPTHPCTRGHGWLMMR